MNSHNSQKVGSNRGRREGIYNRTGEPSVTFCEKEQQRECALVFIKNRSKRCIACSDVAEKEWVRVRV